MRAIAAAKTDSRLGQDGSLAGPVLPSRDELERDRVRWGTAPHGKTSRVARSEARPLQASQELLDPFPEKRWMTCNKMDHGR